MTAQIIAPSLLACNWGEFEKEVSDVTTAGADWIHIDVMDGHFVPPITFGPDVVKVAKKTTSLPLDVHLMIEKPEHQITDFIDAGAEIITVHVETCPHLHRVLQTIHQQGAKAGVAINPGTPVSLLRDILSEVDLLLVMTVNPGWGGQRFIPSSEARIEEARRMIDKSGFGIFLEVDGGINHETAKIAVRAGATVLVAGTSVFRSDNYKTAIEALRK